MSKSTLEFQLPNSGILKISSDVKTILIENRQDKSHKKEAGGVLIGRYIYSSNDIVVDSVTIPYEKDRRGKFFFHKIDGLHQKVLDKNWKQSEGTSNYLGEWHTHPEPAPSPSKIDIKEWKRKCTEDQFDHQFLIFIIVGTKDICAWLVNKKGNVKILKEKSNDV